ncbi:MAG: 30S ribosomal protein S11 [Bdellovibrionales bacterium]|nr:30S ribosomal protein S11 [Bdellovibrionales bacterium]
MAQKKAKATKKKVKKNVPAGKCTVAAGFGNTIVTISDPSGNALCWSSAGAIGFKGSRRGTPFAAQMTAEDAAKKAMEIGVRSVDVYLKGPGAGREPAIRALANAGLKVSSMRDVTPVPHNGCRPPKRRRI